jgi:polyisoprenoid-binding protein YceI
MLALANIFFLVLNLCWAAQSVSEPAQLVSDNGRVSFTAIGRASTISIRGQGEGVSSHLSIVDNRLSGEISFDLRRLKTDMPARDQKMQEQYLETQKYPEAKLIFKNFPMPLPWSVDHPRLSASSFRATLQLHGVEREITGQYSILNESFKTNAKIEIRLADFKIAVPVYLGARVADVVKIEIDIDHMIKH